MGAAWSLVWGEYFGGYGGVLAAAFLTIRLFSETATIGFAAFTCLQRQRALLHLSRTPSVKNSVKGQPATQAANLAIPIRCYGLLRSGCEVLWSRQLVPMLGNSTYAFALLLATYLAGVGLGSCLNLNRVPWESLATLLGALGAAIALSAASTRYMGFDSTPRTSSIRP